MNLSDELQLTSVEAEHITWLVIRSSYAAKRQHKVIYIYP